MSATPLWFLDAPAPDAGATVEQLDWTRRQVAGSSLWALDQRLWEPPDDEPIVHLLGMLPGLALSMLVQDEGTLPAWLADLGPDRDRPASEVASDGAWTLLTVDDSPTLAVWWRREDYTVFGAWWNRWLVSGIRPTEPGDAVRLVST